MTRSVLASDKIHPNVAERVGSYKESVLSEVQSAIDGNDIVVVGMAQNPHCRRAKKMLDGAGKSFKYLEFGSYLKGWKPRLALKMWSGWPTFPMVFVKGVLVGGADELEALLAAGEV